MLGRGSERVVVAGVGVAHHPGAGIGRQHPLESVRGILAPVGDDKVLVCESDTTRVISVADGSVVEEGPGEDEDDRCPVADDEEGIPVPHNAEAYSLAGSTLTVHGPDGSYDVALEQPVDEIWGVDGALVTFVDATDTVQLYR